MDYKVLMQGSEPDPYHTGTWRSFFFYYKWNVEGEIHFDVSERDKEVLFSHIKEGDRLWFQVDGTLIGYVTLTRVVEDPTRDMWEFWYDGTQCFRYVLTKGDPKASDSWNPSVVQDDIAKQWMRHCTLESELP